MPRRTARTLTLAALPQNKIQRAFRVERMDGADRHTSPNMKRENEVLDFQECVNARPTCVFFVALREQELKEGSQPSVRKYATCVIIRGLSTFCMASQWRTGIVYKRERILNMPFFVLYR